LALQYIRNDAKSPTQKAGHTMKKFCSMNY
jgi:hypothetical protein